MSITLPYIDRQTVFRSVDATWTAADWATLPGDGMRYEIVHGVLYASTIPSGFHQWVCGKMLTALDEQLHETHVGFVFPNLSVFMAGCEPVQPDLPVVREEDRHLLKRYVNGVPALIVEILSPGSVQYDAEIKRAAYVRAGMPEYWIVHPGERDVLVHSEPEQATGQYLQIAHVPPGEVLRSPTLPFEAAIAGFFVGAPDTAI